MAVVLSPSPWECPACMVIEIDKQYPSLSSDAAIQNLVTVSFQLIRVIEFLLRLVFAFILLCMSITTILLLTIPYSHFICFQIFSQQVNKPEAERCRDMGATALRQGNLARAVKLLSKSLQLYPLPGVEALLEQARRRQQNEPNGTNGSASTGASSSSNSNGNAANANASASASSSSSPTPPPPQRSTSAASSTGADGRAYTEEQVTVVKRVLKAREGGRGAHYRVLGLQQDCSESDIKKAYRKLSLKVHPDKNSAPQADDAFKAVGLAYATLSDTQKRTIYDRYGEEDPDSRGGGGGGVRPFGRRGGGGVHMHGQHVDPDEIFNMFFGGGVPGGGGGPGGVHFYSTGFGGPGMHFRAGGPRGRPRGGGRAQQQEHEAPGWSMLVQLLPILLMFLLSFSRFGSDSNAAAASMPGVDRYFSLTVSCD